MAEHHVVRVAEVEELAHGVDLLLRREDVEPRARADARAPGIAAGLGLDHLGLHLDHLCRVPGLAAGNHVRPLRQALGLGWREQIFHDQEVSWGGREGPVRSWGGPSTTKKPFSQNRES